MTQAMKKKYIPQIMAIIMQAPNNQGESTQTQTAVVAQQVGVMLSNVETIPGKTIVQSLGVVTGSTVRAKNIGKDFLAGLKNIVGGELTGYTELLQESRNEAMGRMMQECLSRGGNAVVNVRFATSAVAGGAAELFAYGTAVVVQ